jgi:hypothetical protein
MPYQNIDATVSANDLNTVKGAFATILEKLPFLVNLTVDERKSTFKAGPNSLSFVPRAASAAQDNPKIFPASFDIPAFQKDVDLFVVMTELGTLVDSLASQIDDTRLAVGGEAMREASLAYKYIQTAVKNTPGLKPLAEDLGERFKRASKQKAAGTPNTGTGS